VNNKQTRNERIVLWGWSKPLHIEVNPAAAVTAKSAPPKNRTFTASQFEKIVERPKN
jgi:hypothetical protein